MTRLSTVFLILAIGTCWFCEAAKYGEKHKKNVEDHNKKKGVTWKAIENPVFKDKDEDDIKKGFLGVKPDHDKKPRKKEGGEPKGQPSKGVGRGLSKMRVKRAVPASLDWRVRSPSCQSFKNIRTQTCGDCWAVSSAAAMSDRFCLYMGVNRYFSARQVTTCTYGTAGGCDGGYPEDAMAYYYNKGLPTGGDPSLTIESPGCVSYLRLMTNSLQCPALCDSGAALDIKKAGGYYTITSKDVNAIMEQINIYGSVVAIYEVFEDFFSLGTGVYQKSWGASVGWHAVRIIGWGVENGVPYWLCANQWGTGFADNGYFKFLRGSNHCGIEGWVTVVYPIEAYS